jgi:hypothetical protein
MHDPKVPYEDHIQQVKTHPVATEAKLADLEDNMDIRRLLGMRINRKGYRIPTTESAYDFDFSHHTLP